MIVRAEPSGCDTDRVRRLLDAARACVGTPFVHQGRQRGLGLDCVGLLVAAAQAIEYPVADLRAYPPTPTPERLLEARLALSLDPVQEPEEIEPGDVLAFALASRERLACHVGIADAGGAFFLHAYLPARRVIRSRLDRRWRRRLHSVWRWRHG